MNDLLCRLSGLGRDDFEKSSLSDVIKKCRQAQQEHVLNELNLTDVIFNWCHALFLKNQSIMEYTRTHHKLSEITDELEISANFFNSVQKDSLTYFYAKSLWEDCKCETDPLKRDVFINELKDICEKLRKIRVSSDYYNDAIFLLGKSLIIKMFEVIKIILYLFK